MKSKVLLSAACVTFALLSGGATAGTTQVAPDVAMKMLNKQAEQLEQQIVAVGDRVFTAVGYHGATTSMIVGDDGVIIVDTLMGPTSAQNALNDLRAHSDLPVKAIIYTHSHGDHTGGAQVFADSSDGQPVGVYARAGFGHEYGGSPKLLPLAAKRGIRQFGRKLPQSEATHRGVAAANTIDHDRAKGHIAPTIQFDEPVYRMTIANVEIELHSAPGETDDALYVWLPKDKVLFSGDNFYHSFPNLYAIRGTPFRDPSNWAASVGKMAQHQPHYLVPGHTLPIHGQAAATGALSDYSEAIQSVYDQTVEGMNTGKGPDQLAYEVKLPKHLRDKSYLTEFYGTVPHAVRAIYAGLLGWYDGNPTNLNPLEPRLEAERMAKLAGGQKALVRSMEQALSAQDFQWALELADQVRWLDGVDIKRIREVKVAALRGLAAMEYNPPNRNYYLSYANELESGELKAIWF
ncbi:alkyl/aryl-sulfatase [Ferrimonas pelagia]|uniref:Alkyl/aryl-sulfatase n=1 Tax=Ferrimonas pelagia TaxID=1177826 RepID=A0ABP9EGJ6_9GAMM